MRAFILKFSAAFILAALALAARAEGPKFETASGLKGFVLPGRSECEEQLSPPWEMNTRKIVEFQAELMANRRDDFTPEFIKSRTDVAYRHAKNSIYFYTLQKNNELSGTFGLTFSDYGAAKNGPRLPEEDSLHTTLDRPLSKNGKSFIVEGRTYGMLPEFRHEVFPALLKLLLDQLEPRLQRMPDLRDQKIINTYGGREGVLMYKAMGFELVDENPVEVYGKPMWKLHASPNTVSQRVQNVGDLVNVEGFPTPLSFRATPTQRIAVMEGSYNLFLNSRDGKHALTHFSALAADTELAPGLWAAGGSGGGLIGDKVVFVNQLAKPYHVAELGVHVASGGAIAFGADGRPLVISGIDGDSEVAPGVWAKKGSRIDIQPDGYYVFETAKPCVDADGHSVPAGSTIFYEKWSGGGVVRSEYPNAWHFETIRRVLSQPFLATYIALVPEIRQPIVRATDPLPQSRFPGLAQLTTDLMRVFLRRPNQAPSR